jgi:hypothetical protein
MPKCLLAGVETRVTVASARMVSVSAQRARQHASPTMDAWNGGVIIGAWTRSRALVTVAGELSNSMLAPDLQQLLLIHTVHTFQHAHPSCCSSSFASVSIRPWGIMIEEGRENALHARTILTSYQRRCLIWNTLHRCNYGCFPPGSCKSGKCVCPTGSTPVYTGWGEYCSCPTGLTPCFPPTSQAGCYNTSIDGNNCGRQVNWLC